MNKKAFCLECRDDTEYHIEESNNTVTVNGKDYTYPETIAVCNKCSSEIYVSDLADDNLKRFDRFFREKEGIISLEKVQNICEKYGIEKESLSLLFGWEKSKYVRFYNGNVPPKSDSDRMKAIYDSPQKYVKLLIQNKNAISPTDFDKSFEKAESLIIFDEK